MNKYNVKNARKAQKTQTNETQSVSSSGKDPAFLFYSKDFYEGTRMMLPEERACYIDLLIYQHQNNGVIPNDLRRLKMYCSGVDNEVLIATLEAKFKLGDMGWYNERLRQVVEDRSSFSKKQSVNGVVGQFWKKANANLSKSELRKLKKVQVQLCANNQQFFDDWLSKTKVPKEMLEAMLKHLENENEIEDENVIVNKDEKGITETRTLVFPFQSKQFLTTWSLWKKYKNIEFGFKYKSKISEQAGLKKLSNLALGDEITAIAIINQSIENNWKGFFELKRTNNETTTNKTKVQYSDDFKRKVFEKLQPN